jgi:hypothetical protein
VLGGGAAGLPQLLPGPVQPLTKTPESKDPEIPARYFPAGGRASPALGEMQEPIPDFSRFCSKLKDKSLSSGKPENQTIQMVKYKNNRKNPLEMVNFDPSIKSLYKKHMI